MKTEAVTKEHEQIVRAYFTRIGELRAGKAEAVEKLVDMWDPDGTFEFCGAPPVNATFQGRQAIHVLYKNRLNANGMPLRLGGHDDKTHEKGGRRAAEAELGLVETEVHRTRRLDNKLVAGWTTVIGTTDGRGYQVSGSHTFTFHDGKISSLKVVISPKADVASKANLHLEGLSVEDIGRLALAAWQVV